MSSNYRGMTANMRDVWDDALREYRGYDAAGNLVEKRPYTADESADADREANRVSLVDKSTTALSNNLTDISTNDSFLAIPAPTNAQVLAQVQELTRQNSRQARELNGVIRLVINRLEATT
jgi:hypothetical protein